METMTFNTAKGILAEAEAAWKAANTKAEAAAVIKVYGLKIGYKPVVKALILHKPVAVALKAYKPDAETGKNGKVKTVKAKKHSRAANIKAAKANAETIKAESSAVGKAIKS